MRCDKCGKKFENNWTPYNSCPKYEIIERLGVITCSPINLCSECSRKFKEWLEKEDESNFQDK